ncbi:MAG TPA: ABC transporter permease [Rhodothermales bacterium]|nr:ABC transporter permease [Rhodothermales bacterium]
MLRNYLTIVLRTMRRQRLYAFINVAGLAVGLAACLLILLFIRDELTYDRFNEKADRIYRVSVTGINGGEYTPPPVMVAPELEARFPEVERVIRFGDPVDQVLVTAGGKRGYEEGYLTADNGFFDVFSFEALEGDLSDVLKNPGAIVLTRSFARKYFGDRSPIGEALTIAGSDTVDYTVRAVIQDVPTNSSVQFQMLAHRREVSPEQMHWNYSFGSTYLLLRKGVDVQAFERKLPAYVRESVRAHSDATHSSGGDVSLHLQPLTEIHLHPDLNAPATKSGPLLYLYMFGAAALLILLIACVNYMNLATARAARRAREVGVRKVVGAHRGQLARQFLVESVVTAFLALALALVLISLIFPAFDAVVGVNLSSEFRWTSEEVGFLILFVLAVGLLSGAYPALMLSGFQPVRVLKGRSTRGAGWAGLRKGLVVFQFAASVALILATVVIQQQMHFVRTERLNANDDQVVLISNPLGRLSSGAYEDLKRAMVSSPGIVSVTRGGLPGHVGMTMGFWDSTGAHIRFLIVSADEDYLRTLGLKLVSGRDFQPPGGSEISNPAIVNEAAFRTAEYKHPLGEALKNINGGLSIVGVVRDFHFLSLYEKVEPIIIVPIQQRQGPDLWVPYIMARLQKGRTAEGLASVQRAWKEFVPDRPLLFSFLSDELDEAYRSELRLERIFGAFGLVSILVACLGLFGLAAFTAEERTKEIGIRKVLGASVRDMVLLLSKEFVVLILVAVVIAAPVGYFGMERWLNDFAYHIEPGVGVFVLAGMGALIVALVTVSFQAVRAALANPVDSLRYE